MSGALLQLAALSSQDLYLTGNPEITLFKKNYLRYTYFAIETVQVNFDNGSFDFGSETTAKLEKSGDLISKIVLVINLRAINSTKKWGYVNKIGHAIIDTIRASIESDIETINGDWIDIYQTLNKDKSMKENYDVMIGNVASLKALEYSHDAYKLFIPIEFWTGKVTSSAFPICALKNQRFQISVKLRRAIECINYFGTSTPSASELPVIDSAYLLVDYIYLETEERYNFINNNHNYTIETVDSMTDIVSSIEPRYSLIFDKPTKYLVWYVQSNRFLNRNKFLSWATDDNWEEARNNFAKLVWLITRNTLNVSDPNNPYINLNTGYITIGFEPPIVTGTSNAKLLALASKVNGILLFATEAGSENHAPATTDNVILTKNTITFEDMTTTIDEFKADTNTTATQIAFMNIHTNNIIDIFNYGNFINRSDNPVINSSFQLNGKNRFQKRDGYFYNYLQPYYYFKNSPSDGINVYSFSLNPDDLQPSGTINLGNVNANSKDLLISLGKYNNTSDGYLTFFGSGRIRIFAFEYNNIKITDGIAMLSYEKS
jgi:hypothetical protein